MDKNNLPSRSRLLVNLKRDLGNLDGRRSKGTGGTFKSVPRPAAQRTHDLDEVSST